MRKSLWAVAICLASVGSGSVAGGADDAALGKKIENFSLRDFHGNMRSLAEYGDKKAVAVVFLGTECPMVRQYAQRLQDLSRGLADQGVVVLGIDSNTHDTPTELNAFAQMYHIDFPLLKDAGNVVADQFGAVRSPEVFVLDAKRVVRYHGRIDDQFAPGVHRPRATTHDLSVALNELLAGKPISQPSTKATGCLIARTRKIEPHGDVTYTKHVAKIVNRSCAECHREGELAPFPLTTYDEVVGWADMIREVVSESRMPPWHADPQFGKFSNDCSLSSQDKETVFTWIDNGCPEGDKADLPARPTYVTGWRIGNPDGVYRMAEAYRVPAEGTVDYQYFTIDPQLKEDVWISAAEARPGNSAVVHHVVLFAVPPGRKIRNPEEAQANGQMIAVYAPGMNPWKYPEGTALKVEAGSTFIVQAHYTPNGTAQDDQSYVGLKFVSGEKVKKRVRYSLAVNPSFELKPGSDDTKVVARSLILRDTLLLNLYPHMHYRGKSFRFEVAYPDGTTEVLLDVPRYDFAWQLRYDLAEPKLIPKGSRMICTAHFDNSENNPANPDPTKTVRFGLQTWEEMMVGYYTTVPAADDPTVPDAKPAGGAQ